MTEPTLTEQVKKRLDSTGGYYSAETCLQFIAPILAAHDAKATAQAEEIERLKMRMGSLILSGKLDDMRAGDLQQMANELQSDLRELASLRAKAEEIERLRESLLFRMGADQALRGELLDLRAKVEQFRQWQECERERGSHLELARALNEFSRLFPAKEPR